MRSLRRLCLLALIFFPLMFASTIAPGQDGLIRIVLGSPPGSTPDTLARLLAPAMSEHLKQSVIVENRPGANGGIAIDVVARATPDGQTILVAPMGSVSVNPHLYPKGLSNPMTGLAPVTVIAHGPLYLAVRAGADIGTLPDLVRYARANPGKLTSGSSGIGSLPQLAVELFKLSAGIDFLNVPFGNSPAAANAIAAGDVDFMVDALVLLRPHVGSGKMRVLAVSWDSRTEAAPDIPTFAEAGVANMVFSGWIGLLAPAATPTDIVARLNAAVALALKVPETRKRMVAMGAIPGGNTSEEFGRIWRADYERWGTVVRDAGIKLE